MNDYAHDGVERILNSPSYVYSPVDVLDISYRTSGLFVQLCILCLILKIVL